MRFRALFPSAALVICTASGCISTTTVGRPREAPPVQRTAPPDRNTEDGWVLLGQRDVSDRMDHDVIRVGANEGSFRKIRIVVRKADVNFRRVRVHYRRGEPETIELRHTIQAGGSSRVIDLAGGNRIIDRVDFWYDAEGGRGNGKGKGKGKGKGNGNGDGESAVVRLLGKH